MERLTERSLDYCTQHCPSEKMISCAFYKDGQAERCLIANMYDRLAYYEDLEEQGRLVVLPCKVGDTVYVLKDTELFTQTVVPLRVQGISVTSDNRDIVLHFGGYPIVNAFGSAIGKRVFLTRADAEAAMKGVSEDA